MHGFVLTCFDKNPPSSAAASPGCFLIGCFLIGCFCGHFRQRIKVENDPNQCLNRDAIKNLKVCKKNNQRVYSVLAAVTHLALPRQHSRGRSNPVRNWTIMDQLIRKPHSDIWWLLWEVSSHSKVKLQLRKFKFIRKLKSRTGTETVRTTV